MKEFPYTVKSDSIFGYFALWAGVLFGLIFLIPIIQYIWWYGLIPWALLLALLFYWAIDVIKSPWEWVRFEPGRLVLLRQGFTGKSRRAWEFSSEQILDLEIEEDTQSEGPGNQAFCLTLLFSHLSAEEEQRLTVAGWEVNPSKAVPGKFFLSYTFGPVANSKREVNQVLKRWRETYVTAKA